MSSVEPPERSGQRLGSALRERLGHDEADRRDRSAAGELERGAARDQLALVEDVDLVGEPLGLLEVVRRQHDGDPVGAQLLEQLPHAAADLRVQPGGRLVDEHQLRTADEGEREAEALLLSAREPPVRRPAALVQREALHQQIDREGLGVQPGEVTEHLVGAGTAPCPAGLQHDADPGEELGALADRVEAEDTHRAALRAAVALAGLERRGLACAVRAQHGGDGVRLDLEGAARRPPLRSPYRITSPSRSTAGRAWGARRV